MFDPAKLETGVRLTPEILTAIWEEQGRSEFSLELQGKGLSVLDGLERFPKLRCLDISWNDLEICHGLDALRQLKELKAYRNRLASTGGLQELKLLEHLHLQGNRIARMGADFDSLRNLTFLRLDKNLLTRIEHVDRLGNLTYLDLSHNCITEAQGFRHLRSLETLLLNHNKLAALGDIPACVSLQTLELSGNHMSSLKGLHTLVRLSELRCSSSGLLSLSIDDAGIARLPGLTELFVSGNRIHSLAPVQQAFPALETLDISNNELAFEDISRCVACLPSLLSLQFQGNPLPVPADFVSVLKMEAPLLETIDGKPVLEGDACFSLGERPSTAAGRRPSTPAAAGQLTPTYTLGRPSSASSLLRPGSSSQLRRPSTPGASDVYSDSPRSPRPTMRTALSKTGPIAKVISNEELAASVQDAQARLAAMRRAMTDAMKKFGVDPATVLKSSAHTTTSTVQPASIAEPAARIPAADSSSLPIATLVSSAPVAVPQAVTVTSRISRPPSGKRKEPQTRSTKASASSTSKPFDVHSAQREAVVSPTKPVGESPKRPVVRTQRPTPSLADAPSNPLFTFVPPAAPVSSSKQPLFIKSTRRRDNSTGKLLPLPVQPPLPLDTPAAEAAQPDTPSTAHEALRPALQVGDDAGIAEIATRGPSLRPSSAVAVSTLSFARLLGARSVTGTGHAAGGSLSARTLNLVPDDGLTSPRYVSDKTAELRGRPAREAQTRVAKFRIPSSAQAEIRARLLPNAQSLALLHRSGTPPQ